MTVVGDLEYTLSIADICVSSATLALIFGIFVAGLYITQWNFRFPELALSRHLSIFTCLATLLASVIGMGLLINRIIASAAFLETGLNPDRTNINRFIYQVFGNIVLHLFLLFIAIVHCISLMNRCKSCVSLKKIKIFKWLLIGTTLLLMPAISIAKFVVNLLVTIHSGPGDINHGLETANTVIDLLFDCFLIVVCLELFAITLGFAGVYVHRRSSNKMIWVPWEMVWAFLAFSAARIASSFVDYGFDSQRSTWSDRDRVDRIWSFNLVWLLLSLLLLNHFVMMSPSMNHKIPGIIRKASPSTREQLDRHGASFLVATRRFTTATAATATTTTTTTGVSKA